MQTLHICTIEYNRGTDNNHCHMDKFACNCSFSSGSKAGPSVVSVAPQTCRHDLYRPHPSDRVVRPLLEVVLRTPKGILVLVMAPRLRVGTECSGMELVPYALNKIGLRGYFRMAFICERDGQCRKVDPAMPSGSNQARKGSQGCGEAKITSPSRP